jgi:hypothetical protein
LSVAAALQALDGILAPAYGPALPPLSDRRLSHFAAADWSPEVAELLRAENRQIELAVVEALAARCTYPTDYAGAIAQGAQALADRDIIERGYRGAAEIALLRRAARERAQSDLRASADYDCASQEHRLEDTLAQVQSELRPESDEPPEAPPDAAKEGLHAQLVKIARLEGTASRCAVREDAQSALEALRAKVDREAAVAGVPADTRNRWQAEGGTFGEFAFATWPGVACDQFRHALVAQIPLLQRASKP